MKCSITELEIESLYRRIKDKDIDLQPDFQRGEVWSDKKKKKLIDTILRGWQIPPIHVVENNKYVDEVLDGQQRLAAIRDFMDDEFTIDGNIKPIDDDIIELNKMKFSNLNDDIKRKIKKYSIRVVRITEHKPEEAAELFFRLNQPSLLTSAEQRNAFFGTAREEVKRLVNLFEKLGGNKQLIGFSNSRMAYDDIISKLCFTLEQNTLTKKITSNNITEKFISEKGFGEVIYSQVQDIIKYFLDSLDNVKLESTVKLNLNKATLYSWLVFTYRNKLNINHYELGTLIYTFEGIREGYKGKVVNDIINYDYNYIQREYPYFQSMILLFNQKASMGSTDATSIIFRDIILEISKEIILEKDNKLSNILDIEYRKTQNLQQTIEYLIGNLRWGEKLNQ
ncbi:DUF262 domain-containing protein [uncultured Clostridium sp.]|uniref:DUF262 domain-containing protein n=1 Tax=uncultured Clostridium sp. TaxID=59620 RepID=UPI0025E58B20|nr:DUF262 domain-containing protein [uncultured Clostridium sp.]